MKVLIKQRLIKEEGYKSIKIAKENGPWTILDAVESLLIPEDVKEKFKNYKGLMKCFNSPTNSAKKILLYWGISA